MPLIPKQEPPYYETGSTEPIKEFTALLNQTGTAAPALTILKNTTGETIVAGYQTIGAYTLTGTFPVAKTVCLIQNNNYYSTAMQSIYPDGGTTIYITSEGWSGTDWEPLNDNMTNVAIQILIYP